MKTNETWSVVRQGRRLEIKMEASSISLSDTPDNEALAFKIVRAVNEHDALVAVAEAAKKLDDVFAATERANAGLRDFSVCDLQTARAALGDALNNLPRRLN